MCVWVSALPRPNTRVRRAHAGMRGSVLWHHLSMTLLVLDKHLRAESGLPSGLELLPDACR